MARMGRRFALLGVLLLWHPEVLRAENPPFYSFSDVPWNEPLALLPPVAQPPVSQTLPPAPSEMPSGRPFVSPGQYVLPPPLDPPESVAAPQPVNGTWRDEGQYVVIEVNGQQLRLAKSALGPPPSATSVPGQIQIPTGSVHGRLLQRGRPLVGCSVVIVPMHKDGTNDENGIRQPLSAISDADGVYGFANVPVGSYKLTWLPAGTNQWIRRIEMKPDVFVHEGQDVTVKDIRMAMQTIN